MNSGSLLFLLVLLPALVLGQCSYPSTYTLNFGAFAKDSAFLIASSQGYFAEQGVRVNFKQVSGSVQQFDSLFAGQYDIISTATDNVANRVVNQHLNLTIVGAIDLGIGLDFVVNTNNITSWEAVENKPIAVDAPDSGFVLQLLYMARAEGVTINPNLFQLVGGAFQRYNALAAGFWTNPATNTAESVVASMLSNPFTARVSPPLSILAKFSDYVAPFQGTVHATRTDWLRNRTNQDALVHYLAAYAKGQKFVSDPANRNAVIAVLQTTGLTAAQAAASYAEITYSASGIQSDCRINTHGLENVIRVRQSLGGFSTPVNVKKFVKNNQPFGFNDARFCHKALELLECDGPDSDGSY